MKEFLLQRFQKNDVFKCIQVAGLSPLNFEWGEEQTECGPDLNYSVSLLKYKSSDFYFKFDRTDVGMFVCKVSPGALQLVEELGDIYHEWDEVLEEFGEWLYRLEKEIAPDFWEQLKEYAPDETFVGTAEISNAPFSNSEAENIIASLDKLQAQIEENFSLQGDQLAYVKKQMEYLKDGAKRLGRKDWINILISVIVNIGITLALDPQKAKLLWGLVKSCFASLLTLPAP